jgi:hypothetical protein
MLNYFHSALGHKEYRLVYQEKNKKHDVQKNTVETQKFSEKQKISNSPNAAKDRAKDAIAKSVDPQKKASTVLESAHVEIKNGGQKTETAKNGFDTNTVTSKALLESYFNKKITSPKDMPADQRELYEKIKAEFHASMPKDNVGIAQLFKFNKYLKGRLDGSVSAPVKSTESKDSATKKPETKVSPDVNNQPSSLVNPPDGDPGVKDMAEVLDGHKGAKNSEQIKAFAQQMEQANEALKPLLETIAKIWTELQAILKGESLPNKNEEEPPNKEGDEKEPPNSSAPPENKDKTPDANKSVKDVERPRYEADYLLSGEIDNLSSELLPLQQKVNNLDPQEDANSIQELSEQISVLQKQINEKQTRMDDLRNEATRRENLITREWGIAKANSRVDDKDRVMKGVEFNNGTIQFQLFDEASYQPEIRRQLQGVAEPVGNFGKFEIKIKPSDYGLMEKIWGVKMVLSSLY